MNKQGHWNIGFAGIHIEFGARIYDSGDSSLEETALKESTSATINVEADRPIKSSL